MNLIEADARLNPFISFGLESNLGSLSNMEEYVYQTTHTQGLNTNPTTLGKKTMRMKCVVTEKVRKAM
jgi:hypothetical protein